MCLLSSLELVSSAFGTPILMPLILRQRNSGRVGSEKVSKVGWATEQACLT